MQVHTVGEYLAKKFGRRPPPTLPPVRNKRAPATEDDGEASDGYETDDEETPNGAAEAEEAAVSSDMLPNVPPTAEEPRAAVPGSKLETIDAVDSLPKLGDKCYPESHKFPLWALAVLLLPVLVWWFAPVPDYPWVAVAAAALFAVRFLIDKSVADSAMSTRRKLMIATWSPPSEGIQPHRADTRCTLYQPTCLATHLPHIVHAILQAAPRPALTHTA